MLLAQGAADPGLDYCRAVTENEGEARVLYASFRMRRENGAA
jgi:hypothetical protein